MNAAKRSPVFSIACPIVCLTALILPPFVARMGYGIGELGILYYLGAHAIFYFLAIIGCICTLVAFLRRETPRILRITTPIYVPFTLLAAWILYAAYEKALSGS
jgi:hypothetical protein